MHLLTSKEVEDETIGGTIKEGTKAHDGRVSSNKLQHISNLYVKR